jgi:hypothetical protein
MKDKKYEIVVEAFCSLYGRISYPIEIEIKKKEQKIVLRIISPFGEECTKVLTV